VRRRRNLLGAFYLDDDPGVLISACLFSDGAAATIWRGTPGPVASVPSDFNTKHVLPTATSCDSNNAMENCGNLLHRSVPELAAAP